MVTLDDGFTMGSQDSGTAPADPYADVPPPDEPPLDDDPFAIADEPETPVQARKWPRPSEAVYQGTLGEIVRQVAPHTEADPVAVLASLIAALGAVIGREPYMLAANEQHPARIHPLIVGRTSSGAKGTSWSAVHTLVAAAFPDFAANIKTGLTSGEGLIEHVRDGHGDNPDDRGFDEGVADKRLLVIEDEYAAVLNRMKKDGNTLGPILRQAWDGRTLSTMSRSYNRLKATGAHIVVVGHITPGELAAKLAESDLAGGSINRLLIVLSRRSRLRPDGGNLPFRIVDSLAQTLRAIAKTYDGPSRPRLEWTDAARARWHQVYAQLSADRPDGRLTSATARGKAQVLRLALCYAICDMAEAIDESHLDAGLALWNYSYASARWLFGSAENDKGDALYAFIKAAGAAGRTRTEITSDHFKGHAKKGDVDRYLAELIEADLITETKESGRPGKPTLRYHCRDVAK